MLIAGPFIAVWARKVGAIGAVYFAIAFALMGSIAIAPTYTTSVIAGWAFGFRVGYPAVVAGMVGGALLCYLTSRRVAAARVAETFREHEKWDIVRRALLQENAWKALWIVFLLRLSPVLPFGTTNILLATSGVRLRVYLLGTLLGMMPRTGLVTFAAAGAEQLDFTRQEGWWMLGAGIVATAICITVMALVGKHALARATRVPR